MSRVKKLIVGMLIVLSICAVGYPPAAQVISEHAQHSEVSLYEEQVTDLEDDLADEALSEAESYNHMLSNGHMTLKDGFSRTSGYADDADSLDQYEKYLKILSIGEDSVIGYISIPCINLRLPIFHGTNESELKRGVGHLYGSSLPIGGESTHSVLTGHTGLSNTKLFTDIALMENGDMFEIVVCNKSIWYQVDQIKVVEPENSEDLKIVSGKDLCTLVTCTPYGVNSHRLLVRGRRMEITQDEDVEIVVEEKNDSLWIREYVHAVFISMIMVAIFSICVFFFCRYRKQRRKR